MVVWKGGILLPFPSSDFTNYYFVTFERTSGCLISYTYDYPSGEESLISLPTKDANRF